MPYALPSSIFDVLGINVSINIVFLSTDFSHILGASVIVTESNALCTPESEFNVLNVKLSINIVFPNTNFAYTLNKSAKIHTIISEYCELLK